MKKDLADTMEPSLPPVLATCMMSLAMELAAMDAISPYLDAGEMSVGAVVNVSHLAATPEGGKVQYEAEVTKSQRPAIRIQRQCLQRGKKTVGNGPLARRNQSRQIRSALQRQGRIEVIFGLDMRPTSWKSWSNSDSLELPYSLGN